MNNSCENCSSIWSHGTEEWEIQRCASCGWMPGDPVDEDDEDYDDYDDQYYSNLYDVDEPKK